jgi:histidinol-phosphatase
VHTAWRGRGAYRDRERIRVSPIDSLEGALLVHSSVNFLRRRAHWDGFLRLVDRTQVQRGFGDFSAYLWVAEGQGEIALSTTVKAWDVAALKVIVEEAGGRVTDLDGGSGIYGSTVLASNGLLHDAGLTAMRREPGA